MTAAFLIALGKEHRGRGIKTSYFESIEAAMFKTLEEVNGADFDSIV